MVRILVTYIIPLVLPTVFYFLWATWVRKKIEANRAQAQTQDGEGAEAVEAYEISTPWFRLILAGVGLVVIGLILGVFFGPKNPPGSVYQPPRLEDGKVVPGQYAPKPN